MRTAKVSNFTYFIAVQFSLILYRRSFIKFSHCASYRKGSKQTDSKRPLLLRALRYSQTFLHHAYCPLKWQERQSQKKNANYLCSNFPRLLCEVFWTLNLKAKLFTKNLSFIHYLGVFSIFPRLSFSRGQQDWLSCSATRSSKSQLFAALYSGALGRTLPFYSPFLQACFSTN